MKEKSLRLLRYVASISLMGVALAYLRPVESWQNANSVLYNSMTYNGRFRWHGSAYLLQLLFRGPVAWSNTGYMAFAALLLIGVAVISFFIWNKRNESQMNEDYFYLFSGVVACFLDEGIVGWVSLITVILLCKVVRHRNPEIGDVLSWVLGYGGMAVFRILLGSYLTVCFFK